EVDHRAAVSVSAACRVGALVAAVRVGTDVVAVEGKGLYVVVGGGGGVGARPAGGTRPPGGVPAVRGGARLAGCLSPVRVVRAPRFGGPVGERLEGVRGRVVAPDAGVDGHAFVVGRVRLADGRVGEHAVTAVEPAVGTPQKGVERLVRVLVAPAVEQHLRLA